jgi:hypothetical protein
MDLAIPAAGGPQRLPGDYLYYNGRSFKLQEGSWGILRVHRRDDGEGLQPLPGREVPAPAPSLCPAGSPEKRFAVAAVATPLPLLTDRPGMAYVLEADVAAATAAGGGAPPGPLVLHVNVGDCVVVDLANRTAGPVSLHADRLAFDPADSAGVAAGREPRQATDPGQRRRYRFYASPEVGPGAALLRDWGDVVHNPGRGLYGAVIVSPQGATVTDPMSGADMSGRSGWAVDVHPPNGPAYRDFTLLLHDEDPSIGTHRMPYTERVTGAVGINYRATPFTGVRPSQATTPEMVALAGDPVQVHVLVPWSEQAHVFSIENHRWAQEPGEAGSDRIDAVQVGGLEGVTLELEGGAGGGARLPGEYEYGDHRQPYREAGLWGVFRVACPGDAPLRRLGGTASGAAAPGGPCRAPAGQGWAGPLSAVALLVGMLVVGVARQRQRRPVQTGNSMHS